MQNTACGEARPPHKPLFRPPSQSPPRWEEAPDSLPQRGRVGGVAKDVVYRLLSGCPMRKQEQNGNDTTQ